MVRVSLVFGVERIVGCWLFRMGRFFVWTVVSWFGAVGERVLFYSLVLEG